MEALDDTACRQQTASVEEPMRAQAYAECRRLRVAYWQVGTSPNTAQPQPVAADASSCGRATERDASAARCGVAHLLGDTFSAAVLIRGLCAHEPCAASSRLENFIAAK